MTREQEPCEDCVNREQALLALTGINLSTKSTEELISLFNKRIKALPPVTPTHKKGKWEYDAYKDKSGGHCNRCGHFLRYGEKTNFCPDCGAKMEGGVEE